MISERRRSWPVACAATWRFGPISLPQSSHRPEGAPAASFPAGLVALLLFAVAGAAALLLDPGYWSWWLSVGLTRSCSLLMDALFKIIYLGQSFNPAWLIGPALLLVLLEIAVLKKLTEVEEC